MITIEVGNSYSQIKGLKSEEFKALKKCLSYEVDPQGTYFSGGFKRIKSLLDAKGGFPTGLLHRVLREVQEKDYSIKNLCYPPAQIGRAHV